MGSPLRGTQQALTREYDVALLDLDGVVYVGPDAVPGAPEALARAREQGMRLAFVTNNASRPPHAVADHLTDLGIQAKSGEIVTSAQAAARHLADRLPGGASVLVVGTTGLYEALRERGLVPVGSADQQVHAVVQGYSPDLDWKLLAEGAVAINRGIPWVATNADPTVPSPRGPLPGNGSMVAALRHATRREPVVTGKPDPTMHRESVLRSKAERPVVVGDRLDTDIEGANAAGCPSMLVLTGVTDVAALLAAPAKLRPTYLAADLSGLLSNQPEPVMDGGVARCGRWSARRRGRSLVLAADRPVDAAEGSAEGSAGRTSLIDDDAMDAVRALCAAAWTSPTEPTGDGSSAAGSDGQADADVDASGDGNADGDRNSELIGDDGAVRVDADDDDAAEAMSRLGLAVSSGSAD